MPATAKQIHLRRRASGPITPSDFEMVEVTLPELADAEVLVENLWMSVDPYMRRNMDEDAKDLEPWPIGGALDGPAVGRVIASRSPDFAEGDIVESLCGWQSHFISGGEPFIPFLTSRDSIAKRNHEGADPRDYVGLLGVASFTAYAAMVCLNPCAPGETVVISSGAGTVGSLACQIAKLRRHRVVTSAGSDEKVAWLKDTIGVDAAFNYRTRDIGNALAEACPDGIDLVLENASPEHFAACLPLMNELKTMLVSGFVSLYESGGKAAPIPNAEFILDRFLTIKGFRFMDSLDSYDDFVRDMLKWHTEGKLALRETHFNGLERAPDAFAALFDREAGTAGKLLVRLAR